MAGVEAGEVVIGTGRTPYRPQRWRRERRIVTAVVGRPMGYRPENVPARMFLRRHRPGNSTRGHHPFLRSAPRLNKRHKHHNDCRTHPPPSQAGTPTAPDEQPVAPKLFTRLGGGGGAPVTAAAGRGQCRGSMGIRSPQSFSQMGTFLPIVRDPAHSSAVSPARRPAAIHQAGASFRPCRRA